MNDLIVTFVIAKDEVWIDPDGISWRVTHTTIERGETRVWFERVVVTSEDARTACRKWRKLESV